MRAIRAIDAGVTVEPTLELPVEETPTPETPTPTLSLDTLAEAVKSLPEQFASALQKLPVPVIAPRPAGSWVIDVSRDSYGQMSQMTANFHESKK